MLARVALRPRFAPTAPSLPSRHSPLLWSNCNPGNLCLDCATHEPGPDAVCLSIDQSSPLCCSCSPGPRAGRRGRNRMTSPSRGASPTWRLLPSRSTPRVWRTGRWSRPRSSTRRSSSSTTRCARHRTSGRRREEPPCLGSRRCRPASPHWSPRQSCGSSWRPCAATWPRRSARRSIRCHRGRRPSHGARSCTGATAPRVTALPERGTVWSRQAWILRPPISPTAKRWAPSHRSSSSARSTWVWPAPLCRVSPSSSAPKGAGISRSTRRRCATRRTPPRKVSVSCSLAAPIAWYSRATLPPRRC